MAWEENYGSMLYDNEENKRRNKMEVKGKILAKKGDNKAFKLDDNNWYNLNDPVIPYLDKKNPTPKKETGSSTEYKSKYGSPEDVAGKQIGCALSSAATVAGGCAFSD